MPVLLSLETSTEVCSVAVHQDNKLLASAELHIAQAHASNLAPLLEDCVKAAGLSFSDIQAVALSSGPGSYTGLRIGASTAKGICYALNIPMIAVNTLELMAFQMSRFFNSTLLCPMIDAKRMEVYCLIADPQLNIIKPQSAVIVESASFQEILDAHKVVFFGNGSMKCREVIQHTNASFQEHQYPVAAELGIVAMQYWNGQRFADLVHFEPNYHKEFIAKTAKPLI